MEWVWPPVLTGSRITHGIEEEDEKGDFLDQKKKKEKEKKDAARIYMYTMFSKIVRDFHFHSNIRGYLVIETWKLGYDLHASFGITIMIILDFFLLYKRTRLVALCATDSSSGSSELQAVRD